MFLNCVFTFMWDIMSMSLHDVSVLLILYIFLYFRAKEIVKYSKANVAICTAHCDEYASNVPPLPRKSALISASQPIQPGSQRTLRDHGHGLVCHVICLFALPAFARYSFQPAQRAGSGSGWVGLGAWFRAEVVYPSKDGHPPRY